MTTEIRSVYGLRLSAFPSVHRSFKRYQLRGRGAPVDGASVFTMLSSKKLSHGIRLLCYLSHQASGSSPSARRVADALGVPRAYAAKILQAFSATGLVTATRGRSGGYALVKNLRNITVLEIRDALDAPPEGPGAEARVCPAARPEMWRAHRGIAQLREDIRRFLATRTLAWMIEPTGPRETASEGTVEGLRPRHACIKPRVPEDGSAELALTDTPALWSRHEYQGKFV